jgi:hypothetical protein
MELLGVGGIGSTLALAIWALLAERRAGRQQARGDVLAVRLELAQATIKTEGQRADFEKERADALDDALAHAAVTGSVDGAFDRLLQTWHDARATDRRPAMPLAEPAETASASTRSDDLLRPGE